VLGFTGLRVHAVPGTHASMVVPPQTAALAAALTAALADALAAARAE
jgi:thioesterase domain-containing protein